MTGPDSGRPLADRMRQHAGASDHLYGELMRAMADDWEAGGPVREICRGWEQAPAGSVVQLRLLAGLFRLVLTERAPELVRFYPCLGGESPAADAWPEVRPVLAKHVDELHEALDVAPQTNEVGRSNALLVGLFAAARATGLTRIRLLEPGASAGLNLLVDEFRFENPGWCWGPEASPVVLKDGIIGEVERADFTIVSRRGCDVAPVDPQSEQGQLRLRSFVWPFHVHRHVRLSAALAVSAGHPVAVDQAGAGEWLEQQLAEPVGDGVLTVVWQSITEQYWPLSEQRRVAAALVGAQIPLVHVAMEFPGVHTERAQEDPARSPSGPDTDSLLPELRVDRLDGSGHTVVATVGDHGVPVTRRRHGGNERL